MTVLRTLKFTWDGTSMQPLMPGVARDQYTEGEVYPLEVREDRSPNTHNHYFACLQDGWHNLPEIHAERFPSVEHMRKWLLIRCGYRDERTIVASSKAEAQRIAAFIRPMDEFAVVQVHEATVTVYTAKSQSMRAMGKATFQRSKSDVLDALAALIHVSTHQLADNAGKAA